MDFPSHVDSGSYRYEVAAMYFDQGKLKPGPTTDVSLELEPSAGHFEYGFTRGYLSSQAYADEFHNAEIRPAPKTIDYDTQPFEKQYEWLGYHARKLVFSFLQECLDDPSITVDLFAYDLDEPDFIQGLEKLGHRLRAVLDNAPLHTKAGALEIKARAALEASAGKENVQVGHFKRFAHDKVMIQKKDGKPVKVLTGSANFSVRGLYVQANNVLVFDDAPTAELYAKTFDEAFNDMPHFQTSDIAKQWFDVKEPGLPVFSACFSPHKTASVSLSKVSKAIQSARSSVIYAVMELGGGGAVLQQLRDLGASKKNIFSYGITQSSKGLNLYKPGETKGIFASFSFLSGKVPAPFRQEWSGGVGQVIHHKFVVVDFNDLHPVVFTGSSNLAEGGEEDNGDNLLMFSDPAVATAYAVEAIRLVDHYHFRTVMKTASQAKPLQLQTDDAKVKWWQPYYDEKSAKYHDRLLFRR
jgi:phosphatidylserine/phosphatidylglycerophosphate/cardiolipin synthase-like enzyme